MTAARQLAVAAPKSPLNPAAIPGERRSHRAPRPLRREPGSGRAADLAPAWPREDMMDSEIRAGRPATSETPLAWTGAPVRGPVAEGTA